MGGCRKESPKLLAAELKSNQICGRLLALEQVKYYLDSSIEKYEDHAASVGKDQ